MIRPDETLIEGRWTSHRGCALRDANCERIVLLVQTYLHRAGTHEDGTELFRDPADGRVWALTYPERHLPGGGPPRLRFVAPATV